MIRSGFDERRLEKDEFHFEIYVFNDQNSSIFESYFFIYQTSKRLKY